MKHSPDYFETAESWATDTQLLSARSRRMAWTVAGLAVGIAALEAVALAMLVPLKTVQPVTLLVDRQTGFVQTVDPNSPRRLAADDALTQSFLAQYVTAREGFDRATIALDYRKVALLSAGAARSSYLTEMPASNPSSPFQRYPAGAIVRVRVKSVSKLNPGTALVRFDTQQEQPGRGVVPGQAWISVIRYRYTDAPMSLEDRLVNPLGFQVLSYRRDSEVPTDAQAPLPAPATPAATVRPLAFQARSVPAAQEVSEPVAVFDDRLVPLSQVPLGSPLSSSGR